VLVADIEEPTIEIEILAEERFLFWETIAGICICHWSSGM
jgi:hypothetical protein